MSEPTRKLQYVFGPVPSRRLGRSLGVDLAPRKVCSFDCVYCQVGRTTRLTTAREAFIPVAHLLGEIAEKLRTAPRPDYITLSGSGEPTLNAAIGEIIDGIKAMTDVPMAIITNGSMFHDAEVRRACLRADLVLPTLDAADEAAFRAIHRPEASLTLDRVVEGLAAFRREFRGQIWLEVFIVEGVNSSPEQIHRLRALIDRVNPDRIQLNTAVRPTADSGVKALTEEQLSALAKLLGPKAEVIADFKPKIEAPAFAARNEAVLDMIRRRPVTVADIASGLGLPAETAEMLVNELRARKAIAGEMRGDREYFRAL